MLSRSVVASLLLAYTSQSSSAAAAGNPLDGVEQPIIDDANAHSFVLSSSAFAVHFSMADNMHRLMEFVEELFAVRIPKLIAFLVILSFACVLALIIPMLFEEILRRFQTPKHYRNAFRYVLQISIVIIGLWLALAAIGIDFLGIVLTFGVVSIAISPGIGSLVSDVTGAISLQTNDIIQVGTELTINGLRGVVIHMTFSKVGMQASDDPQDIIWVPNAWFGSYPIRIHRGALHNDGSSLEPYVMRKKN
jgi:small-conductance mechanosensitive channel